jgi:hypothetical protein
MGASGRTLIIESAVASGFLLVAALGFRRTIWLVLAARAGRGVFDFTLMVPHSFLPNLALPNPREDDGGYSQNVQQRTHRLQAASGFMTSAPVC